MKTETNSDLLDVNDDLVALLLSVARRADELVRTEVERRSERDFWREAEEEVFRVERVGNALEREAVCGGCAL